MRPFQLPSLFLPVPLSDDVVVVFAKRSLLQTLAQSSLSITEPEQMWRLPVFHLFLPWKVYTRHTVPALCIECNNLSIASLFHTQNRWPSPQNVENLVPCVDGVQCCCTFVLLCCLQPGWRKSDRRFDQGKASLWCGLPCGGSDLILTLCPTSGLRGLVFVWRGVCVSFVLLLDLQWVNHCSHFKLWRQRFLPMRHHSSRACVMWADQAIYVLPQKKLPFASYSFHIVPS